MNKVLGQAGARWSKANKAAQVASYRPYFETDCRYCRRLVASGELEATPILVADVGAAQGFDPRWDLFGEGCRQVGFEPEPAECGRLEAAIEAAGQAGSRFVLPMALADRPGRRRLYVTRDPDASSLYRPNRRFFERMPDPSGIDVVGEIEVEVTTLDALTLPAGDDIDVLKLDVQGAELDVLRGAERRLDGQVLAVIAEASFVELYEGQAMFADIDQFLRGRGFQLFDICYRRWSRRQLDGEFAGLRVGQMTYGDVLYLKDPIAAPDCAMAGQAAKLRKLTAFAEFFSLPDYALELLDLARAREQISEDAADAARADISANTILRFNDRNLLPS